MYQINYEELAKQGYQCVIFDIDNTLTLHGEPADEKLIVFFERLRKLGWKTCLLSNNRRKRVEDFAHQVGSDFIFKANKPSISGYLRAMDLCDCAKDKTIFVGDQLFTDIYGAKRAGIRNILVKPIHPKEEIQIIIKRFFEKIILRAYHKEQMKKNQTGE